MDAALEIVLTIGAVAVVGVLLAVVWMLVLRRLGVRDAERPREDAGLQMHQAQRNGSNGFRP